MRIARTSSVSRTGGSRSPSSNTSVASAGSEPGAAPPTSAWWARVATQPSSSPRSPVPSLKHGATSVMSLRWVPPANGSLRITWSPGTSARPPSKRSMAARTDAGIDPRCTGMFSAWASSSPSAVNTAEEQSARSLMFGLYAARRSTALVSSATPVRRASSTCRDAGSRAMGPVWPTCAPSASARERRGDRSPWFR
ncbi:MAG: hypothetical protein R2726_13700 [Acidimicrobiales bacterium]